MFALSVCAVRGNESPAPPRFLIFHVVHSYYGQSLGTLSDHTDFRYWVGTPDRHDFVSMRAKLIRKTAAGFRFSWSVVQRAEGQQIVKFESEEFVSWNARKHLKSLPEYPVDVFYSSVPANEFKPIRSNKALQPTADRCDDTLSFRHG
jgi:hypothetical protein